MIHIAQENGPAYGIGVHTVKSATITRANLQGFAEANGLLSMEAEHNTARTAGEGALHWTVLPGYGETLSAMTLFPVDAESATDPAHSAALEYRVYYADQGMFQADFLLAPTLNFVPGRGLRFAVSVDGATPTIVDALAHNTDEDWAKAVSDGVRHVIVPITIPTAGYHTLAVYAVDPGVVLEKIVLQQRQPMRGPGAIGAANGSTWGRRRAFITARLPQKHLAAKEAHRTSTYRTNQGAAARNSGPFVHLRQTSFRR